MVLTVIKGLKTMRIFKLLSQFRSYSKNIRNILIWNAIFCFGLGIHLVLYNLFLQGIVHDEVIVGKILGLNFLAQAMIYIPAGLFSDRVGSRKAVIAGVSVFIVALAGNLFASTPGELSIWGFIVGLGHAASIVSFVPLLTEYSISIERKDLFTFAFSTGTFFTFLGTLLGGMLSDSFEAIFQWTQIFSIRITFICTILLLMLCTLPLFLVKESKKQRMERQNQRSILSILKNKPKAFIPIAQFSLSKALAGISLGIITPFMNLFFLYKFSLSPSKISLILAGGTLATVWFMSFNSNVTRKISEVKTVSLYHILSIPSILFLGLTQNIWIAAVAYILFRSTKFALNPIESKIMMEKVEPEMRGLANSFGFMTNSLCISMLGPLAMYVVQVAGNQQGYFLLCMISAVGSLIVSFYFLFAFGGKKDFVAKKLSV